MFWKGYLCRTETTKDCIHKHHNSKSIWIPVYIVWRENGKFTKQGTQRSRGRGGPHRSINYSLPSQAKGIATIPSKHRTSNVGWNAHQNMLTCHQKTQLHQHTRYLYRCPLLAFHYGGTQKVTIETRTRQWQVSKQCHVTEHSQGYGFED